MSLLEEPCDEPVTCDRCKDIIVDEWWHCDICSAGDYDICCRCIQKKRRCKDNSHDLTKWRDDVDLGNSHKGVSPTDQKLPGIPEGFLSHLLSLPHPTRSGRPPSQKDFNDVISPSPAPTGTRMHHHQSPPTHLNLSALQNHSLHDLNGMPRVIELDPSPERVREREKFIMDAILEEICPSITAAPASSAERSTRTERTTMADNPSASNPAAAGAIVQHFDTAQAARNHLNGDIPRWKTPVESPEWSGRPTNPSGEYAYVRAAVHSISVGLQDAFLAYNSTTNGQSANNNADETRRRVEARAWLLFDALKRLHDGGCMLRPLMDFSNGFGGEDQLLLFRQRWVAVCKMLQRFGSAAGMVASGSTEEILEAYVAAPLAMGRKLEKEQKERDRVEERVRKRLKPLQPIDLD